MHLLDGNQMFRLALLKENTAKFKSCPHFEIIFINEENVVASILAKIVLLIKAEEEKLNTKIKNIS